MNKFKKAPTTPLLIKLGTVFSLQDVEMYKRAKTSESEEEKLSLDNSLS